MKGNAGEGGTTCTRQPLTPCVHRLHSRSAPEVKTTDPILANTPDPLRGDEDVEMGCVEVDTPAHSGADDAAQTRSRIGRPIDWTAHAGSRDGTTATPPTTRSGVTAAADEPAAETSSPVSIEWDELARDSGPLAAREAPTISDTWMDTVGRQPALILIPIAYTGAEACAMICLHDLSALFGAARDERQGGAEQGAVLAERLNGGIETQYAASTPYYGANIILVPWATRPTVVARTAAQLELARKAGLYAAWCTLDALHDHKAYHAVSLAFLRIAALTSVGEHGEQRADVWEYARPIVSTRTAHEWAARANLPADEVTRERTSFLEAEQARGRELRSLLIAQDSGNGELIAMADNVRTAADYEDETPFPANGKPTYADNALRLAPFAERPLNLSTSWLARLPPQQVPPGFKPTTFQGILRGWARRKICAAINATADRDFECYASGGSARRRPPYICIGPGGGMQIAHADGIGYYNALSIVWELDPATGLYDKLDFERPGRTHWNLMYLKEIFGIHDDQQLMSLVMHGVRWGVQAPLQIRIAANLERLDDRRRRGVQEAHLQGTLLQVQEAAPRSRAGLARRPRAVHHHPVVHRRHWWHRQAR